MNTGVFIRAKVDGKWGSYDIGDKKLSDEQIALWLITKDLDFIKRLVMILLGRDQNAI